MGIWGLYGPEQTPENYLRQVADQFNCTTTDSTEMVECLRLIDAESLNRARFECTVSVIDMFVITRLHCIVVSSS